MVHDHELEAMKESIRELAFIVGTIVADRGQVGHRDLEMRQRLTKLVNRIFPPPPAPPPAAAAPPSP